MKKIKKVDAFCNNVLTSHDLGTIIMSFGICLLCFIWIGLYYSIQSERQMGVDNAIKETSNLARTFDEHTLRTIKSADQTAFFLKYQYEKEGTAIDIPQYINKGKIMNQPFQRLSIADEKGNVVASNQVMAVPFNVKDRDCFFIHKDIDSGQLFIGKPVLEGPSGKLSIPMTCRINKPDGSFGGVVLVEVDPYYFSDLYKQVNLGQDSSIILIGRDGIVRAQQSGENTDIGQDLSQSMLMERLEVSDTGYYSAKSSIDGVVRLYSYRALHGYPFTVAVGVSEEEFLAVIEQRITRYYLIAGMITIVIVGFIFVLLRVTARQRSAERALKKAHDELERQVEVRTEELSAANEELTAMNEELVAMNEELEHVNQELEAEIMERKRTEEQLTQKTEDISHMAYFDVLTDLPNRAHLNKWLTAEMERAQQGEASGAMLFIDLDELKMVNDTFGHKFGDDIIIMAGTRISAEAGNNAFVARIGGDEFIVGLPGISDPKQVIDIANRMIKKISQKQEIAGMNFHITASVGIAIYPSDGNTSEEIFKNADNAMYAAKKEGKNCWRWYATDMQSEVYEKMVLTNSLRYAIERDELLLYYQPQVRIDSGAVVGFEALLRWNSPEHGLVSPSRFIPLAEQSGMILDIGQWVLQKACQFAHRLSENKREDIHVAVNVSSKELATSDFVENIRNVLNSTGIKQHQLEIEVTESILLVSMEDCIRKLLELQGLGMSLSLDDFGVGYSSLTYLRQLPIDTLKIDKSFINMIDIDTNTAEIIGAIINMAHILNKNVIAEGVETEAQLKYLTANDCDCIQGYLFSKPLPEAEAIKFLAMKS